MAEFTLKRKPVKTLKVNIGEESFMIPLAGSLTPDELAKLDTAEGTRDYFRKFLFNSTKGKEGMEITKEVYDLLKRGEKFI